MRLRFAITGLVVFGAFGQAPGRTIYLSHVESPQNLTTLFQVVRAIGDIRDVSLDEAKKALTVRGTADQVAIAGWLCGEMDKAATPAVQGAVKRDYLVKDSDVPAVQVYFLAHTETPQQIQEMVNAVRSTAAIQRMFPYNDLKAMVLRGTPEQIELADWILSELDTPTQPVQTPVIHDHPAPGEQRMGTAAQVIFLANAGTPLRLQEIVNVTRTMADVQRFFPYNSRNAIVLRGSPEQAELADWLVRELDKPIEQVGGAPQDYKAPGDARMGNLARVWYMSQTHPTEIVMDWIKQVRSATSIQRVFYCSWRNVVVMRGTGDQVARAEQMLKERDKN